MTDKPSELITLTLTRAHMMELLAHSTTVPNRDIYFTVGMFSFIDAFFDQSKETILRSLPFNEEVNNALLHYEGTPGKMLQAVAAHEQGHWDEINWETLETLGISQETFENAYLEALQWAAAIMQSLLA